MRHADSLAAVSNPSRRLVTRLPFVATALLAASLLAVVAASPAWERENSPGIETPTLVAMPTLQAEWVAPDLVLRGVVPDDAERLAIVGRARALPGVSHVKDALKVGAVANPAWLSAAFLPDLRHALHARVSLEDARLLLEGDVASESDRVALLASVSAYRSGGVRVIDRLRVLATTPPPPPAGPAPVR